jgi:hypothetical protein
MMESSSLRTKWAQLSRREQAMVTIAALLLGVTLLWSG